MHILHFIESLEFGGAEKVVVNLCHQALASGHQVSLCLSKRRGPLLEELDSEVQLHFLDAGEGNNPKLPGMVARLCRENRVDVLHGHEWGVFLESALAVRKLPDCRHVHTFHGHYTQYPPGFLSWLKRSLRHGLERRLCRYCQAMVAVSDSIADYMRQEIRLPAEKVVTIHNGIADFEKSPESPDQPAEPKRLKSVPAMVAADSHSAPLRLLWVGRVAPVKNLPMLIAALVQLKAKKIAFELDLVGDGPELARIRQLVGHHQLSEQVHFHGFCHQVAEFYQQADVFVMTSDYEGISIAALEAMRAALPIVATQVGGLPETIVDQQTGLLVPPGDADALANAIARIATDQHFRQQAATLARERFLAEFEQSVMFNRYLAFYQAC